MQDLLVQKDLSLVYANIPLWPHLLCAQCEKFSRKLYVFILQMLLQMLFGISVSFMFLNWVK